MVRRPSVGSKGFWKYRRGRKGERKEERREVDGGGRERERRDGGGGVEERGEGVGVAVEPGRERKRKKEEMRVRFSFVRSFELTVASSLPFPFHPIIHPHIFEPKSKRTRKENIPLTQAQKHKERHQPNANRIKHDLVNFIELPFLRLLLSPRSSIRRVPSEILDVFLDEPGPPGDVVGGEEDEHEDEGGVGCG